MEVARSGVSFVAAPSPLFHPLGLAAPNTGMRFAGLLPVTLTLTPRLWTLRVWTPRVGPIPLCLAALNTGMRFRVCSL
eukprot:365862-Chlamydomonas_euryale.AAC.6